MPDDSRVAPSLGQRANTRSGTGSPNNMAAGEDGSGTILAQPFSEGVDSWPRGISFFSMVPVCTFASIEGLILITGRRKFYSAASQTDLR